ncbi:MAG: transketolase, partial [Candidatus Krumholzibacteriota bacterium]|nr:transketolase [Candidatus Krumholzibacteriota bacterium]
ALAGRIATMIGGSADLGGSNKSELDGAGDFGIDGPTGRNIHFGVREHAMGAIVNGMALHGGVVPYGATFLIFSDYMRPALRLSALMNIPSNFVFTHDSVGLGEDGPTHQPIEHLMSLRTIPRFTLFRPADANETAAAWKLALERPGPCALVLTRQNLPVLADQGRVEAGTRRGAYILAEAPLGTPAMLIVATGSEVTLALEAQGTLSARGIEARVVSMPSWELWREQDGEYRARVLPPELPRLVIEAGSPHGWRDIVGDNSTVIGLDRFGESAPGSVALKKLGFNLDNVVSRAEHLVASYGDAAGASEHPAAG